MQGLISSWDILSTMTPADYGAFRRRWTRRAASSRSSSASSSSCSATRRRCTWSRSATSRSASPASTPSSTSPRSTTASCGCWRAAACRSTPGSSSATGRRSYQPHRSVVDAWLVVYREPDTHWELYELAEDLLDLEDAMRQWRLRHVTTVERIIGLKTGTGGTAGRAVPARAPAARAVPRAVDGADRAVTDLAISGRPARAGRCRAGRASSRPPTTWRAIATSSSCPTASPTWPATRSACSRVAVRAALDDVLDAWATRAVDGHVEGAYPWVPYHETMRETAARLVGARPGEAVVMNSLTVNLHLMLGSFYRPTPARHRIVIEADVFPSDRYAADGRGAGPRLRPRRGGRGPHASTRRAPPAHGGRHRLPRAGGCRRRRRRAQRRRLPHGRPARHPGHHRGRPSVPARWRSGTWPTPPATSRCDCTTGTSTSPCGATTSTSTRGPVRSAGASSTSATVPTPRSCGRAAGGVTIPRPASTCRSPFGRNPAPTDGRSPTRRSSPWPRCGCRWSCSTTSAWTRCGPAASASPASWSACSTPWPPAARWRSSRPATLPGAAPSSASRSRTPGG